MVEIRKRISDFMRFAPRKLRLSLYLCTASDNPSAQFARSALLSPILTKFGCRMRRLFALLLRAPMGDGDIFCNPQVHKKWTCPQTEVLLYRLLLVSKLVPQTIVVFYPIPLNIYNFVAIFIATNNNFCNTCVYNMALTHSTACSIVN